MTLQELKEKIKSGELTDVNVIADIVGGDDKDSISFAEFDSLPGPVSGIKAFLLFNELKPKNT